MNSKPSLTELRALTAIVSHRSFRKAAGDMDMAPSTLSHMMTALETRLEVRLLHRTTRSVSPTAAGQRLVDRLAPILHAIDSALVEIESERQRPSGQLRLTASETASMILMQTAIPTFIEQYPEVSVDLVAKSEFVDIVAEGFDAGFRLGEDIPLDMIAVRFGEPSRMLPVASPAYLRNKQIPLTPDDLKDHQCICSRTPAGRSFKWEFERQGESLSVDVAGALRLNRSELMLQAAISGLGIAFVPQLLAKPYLKQGQLVPLLESWCPYYPGLALYYPGYRQVPVNLRAFIEVLKTTPNSLDPSL
ncbi:LysR family transcriptional regulator [Saccharospirillum mangrovi]|uniref:LysR family transcriptional regulator n=1 Tax=Saccharospirillum mangrovi TaxID=2161747 RepID=UPI000D3D14A2|nr:LysR family transcriptional regulator [Saccharospirillum mangrovi]